MSIYFVQEANNRMGLIKIGLSVDPEKRLKSMQTNSPVLLDLLATLPGSEEIEKRIHKKFARERVRGEWFEASKDLLTFVEKAVEWRMRSNRMGQEDKEDSWRYFCKNLIF